jgi:glycosyltransferase involved in cell wall biosynthesis
MRKGAGIKNKILQAWAMSKAVIASPIAVGGLVVREGENILIRAGAEAIAEAIVGVIRDRGWRQHLGQEGRKTICAHYTWMQKAEALDAVFQAVAGFPQGGGSKHGFT